MNLMSILWQISFITMILAFGIEIGLSLGLSNFNKRYFVMLYSSLIVGCVIVTRILSTYSESLKTFMYDYISIVYLVMAILMILIALDLIRRFKKNKTSFSLNVLANVIIISSCIILMALNTVFIAPTIGMSVNLLNIYSTAILVIILSITYLISKYLKNVSKPYPIILSEYMLVFSEYFIFSALFLPNISSALQKTTNITLYSSEYLVNMVLVLFALVVLGIIINKKNSLLK